MVAQRPRESRAIDRWNPTDARAVLEALIPDDAARQRWLTVLAEAIQTADRIHPCAWAVTLFPRLLRLNVGSIETVVFDGRGAMLVLDGGAFTDAEIDAIRERPELGAVDLYRSVPGTVNVRLAYDAPADAIAAAHARLLPLVERAAARVKTGTVYFRSHSPGVVVYVVQATGVPLQQPGYGREVHG
jgi:hypothetical protein